MMMYIRTYIYTYIYIYIYIHAYIRISCVGIGKTTLTNEICMKWARDGFLSNDFNIVILITLRVVEQRSLEDCVIELIGDEAYEQLKKSLGAKCLLLLDGLDEMAVEQQQNDSLIMKLLNGVSIEFEKARIVITSRPKACQKLNADRIIEIIGLREKEIVEFIQKSFPGNTESAEALLKQLNEYPQLHSLCHVPLSLVIIVDIFKYRNQCLPSTLTELYRLFIAMRLIREGRNKSIVNDLASASTVDAGEEILHKLFADIPNKEMKGVLILSKLAYYSFFNRDICREQKKPKIIFTEDDLFQCGSNFDGHGLLQVEYLYTISGSHVTYKFIHILLQEFFCAIYMLTLSQEEQYRILKEYFNDYPTIMIFYCGLTSLNFHQVIYSKITLRSSAVIAVKCLYEGQWNTAPPHKSTSPLALDLSDSNLLQYDLVCVSYVFCNHPVIRLRIDRCSIEDKNVGILTRFCLNKNKNTMLQELHIQRNYLTGEGMKHVMEIVKSELSYVSAIALII